MKMCDVRDCKPGMILAEPVFTSQGVLLLSGGVALTEKNIWVMKSWGVRTLSVESDSKGGADECAMPDPSGSIEDELRRKFGDTLENEIMLELMSLAGQVIEARHRRKASPDG
jgi:hypothetical protein